MLNFTVQHQTLYEKCDLKEKAEFTKKLHLKKLANSFSKILTFQKHINIPDTPILHFSKNNSLDILLA